MAYFTSMKYGKDDPKRMGSKHAHLYTSGDPHGPLPVPENLPNVNKPMPKVKAMKKKRFTASAEGI